jgi:diadenosine tetraphosphatase ApaH/serine/threonine PP2A family protein phosphatase
MRFAAIADIHGNYLALDAVLADIAAQGVTDIVDLGDMIGGPMESRKTLDRLMALDAVHILGNHDRYPLERSFEELGPWDRTAHGQLSAHHFDWLRTLPATHVYRDKVFLCHAMPTTDEVYWLEQVAPDGAVTLASREAIARGAEGIEQRLMLCAHSHVPRAVRLADGRMIVNPGSVGIPGYRDVHPYPHVMQMGTPDACYAILDETARGWSVTFRQVPYDHMAMAALAERNGHPKLARMLATGWMS